MNSKHIFCDRWTYQTLCCYKYKTNCGLCPNNIVCGKYVKAINEYNIKPVKYAMLKTLEKLGKPKGEWNMDYDSWLLRQADEYMKDCEPEMDREGEYTKCQECFDKCELYYEMFGEENDTRDE